MPVLDWKISMFWNLNQKVDVRERICVNLNLAWFDLLLVPDGKQILLGHLLMRALQWKEMSQEQLQGRNKKWFHVYTTFGVQHASLILQSKRYFRSQFRIVFGILSVLLLCICGAKSLFKSWNGNSMSYGFFNQMVGFCQVLKTAVLS